MFYNMVPFSISFNIEGAIYYFGRSPFLTIQLSPQFGFDHRTAKLGIFSHPTLKTVHIWPLTGFYGGFADIDATWRWGPPVSPPLLSLSLYSLLSLSLLSYPSPLHLCRPPPSPHASPARPAALARGRAAARFPGGTGLLRSSSSPSLLCVPAGAQGRHGVHRPRKRRTT
jgi:hypothetical protein